IEIAAVSRRDSSAPRELQGLVRAERQRQRHSDPRILLPIVSSLAVDGRAAALVERSIGRDPEASQDRVTAVDLRRVERRLLALLIVEEIAVFGEHPGATVEIETVRAEGVRQAELGLECPPVRS